MALRAGITSRRGRPVLPFPRAFSSSSSPFPPPPPPANDPDAAHSPSSTWPPNPDAPRNPAFPRFLDIGDRLRSSPTPPSPRGIPTNPPRLNPARGAPTPSPDVEDVRRMLHNFRSTGCAPSSSEPAAEDIRRMLQNFRSTGGAGAPSTSAPGAAPSPSASGATPLFMDLFWKTGADQGPNAGQGVPGLDAMPGSLRAPRPQMPFRPPSLSNNSRRELERNSEAVGWGQEEKNSVIALKRNYSYEELGKRLGELRPAGACKDGKDWFSLKELQGRIAKLVELEKQEKQSAPLFSENQYAASISELRNCFENLQKQEKPAPRVNMQALALQNLGGQLDYMGRPPQEELLEKYFHPDHMSSEEKMKLELQRVRDEFKMSENDCGSARVQIAQLTLKIKHLSAVLHKKDKHSRKGLQEMVQRRKKYLKYLRTTDWDSYCLVLSKLGLRDVPEYKAPDYKSKATTKVKSKKKSKGKGKGKKGKMKA